MAACGNDTLIVVVGALETIWSNRERTWAEGASDAADFPALAQRHAGIQAHERLLSRIVAGDVAGAERRARAHLDASLLYTASAAADEQVGWTSAEAHRNA